MREAGDFVGLINCINDVKKLPLKRQNELTFCFYIALSASPVSEWSGFLLASP